MNTIRERILLSVSDSLRKFNHSEHKDLINFCVCSEYFMDYDDDDNEIEPDFNELIVIVERDWLFNYMGVENPRLYLQEEYTSDDSIDWFDEANRCGKIIMIAFN